MSRILAALLLVAWTCTVSGQALDLYAGEVVVIGKGEAERQQAVPSALIHVLQKLSGQRELPLSPELDQALGQASRMQVAFHYNDRQRLMPDGSALDETWLVVNFRPASVDRVLLELDLPRWRQERPPLTFWIVLDDGAGRRLMPLEYAYAWDAMNWVASLRGLPVDWPDFDPEALPPVDLQLLWGGFTEQLPASQGASGGVVVVAARRLAPDWQLRWTYDNGLETVSWRTRDRDLSLALADGLHGLTDLVAARDSIRGGPEGAWEAQIVVSGLGVPGAYARCLEYLENLSLVDQLRVQNARAGAVGFRRSLNAEPRYLLEVLRRDGVLEPGNTPEDYRLLP